MWIRNSTLLQAQSALCSLTTLLFLLFPCCGFTAPIGTQGIVNGQSIGTEGIRNSSSAAVGCADATTFLARTSGLSGTEQTAYTNLICGLIADGAGCSAWAAGAGQPLDALYLLATNTTTTAALNLCSTSFSLVTHGSPTFTADRGYTGDATAAYLDTQMTPSTAGGNFSLNSASFGVCVTNSRTTAQAWAAGGGENTSNNTTTEILNNFTGNVIFTDINEQSFNSTAVVNGQGLWAQVRTSSTAIRTDLNGATFASFSVASTNNYGQSLLIIAANVTGTVGRFSGDSFAAAFIGGGLTSGKSTSIFNRLHTALTALGVSGC